MNTRTGGSAATIHYTTRIDGDRGEIDLNYQLTTNGQTESVRYSVKLETTHPHLGGLRWWFRCPLSGSRARVLYLVSGQSRFASRKALGLTYRSRNQDEGDRARTQAQKIRRRMGQETTDPHDIWLMKPKWMHWETFSREYVRAKHYNEIADRAWMGQARALLDSFGVR